MERRGHMDLTKRVALGLIPRSCHESHSQILPWVSFPDPGNKGLMFWVTFLVTWGRAYCLKDVIITFSIQDSSLVMAARYDLWKLSRSQSLLGWLRVCSIWISDLRLESNLGPSLASYALCGERKGLVTLQPSSWRHSRNLMWPMRSTLFIWLICCHGTAITSQYV